MTSIFADMKITRAYYHGYYHLTRSEVSAIACV